MVQKLSVETKASIYFTLKRYFNDFPFETISKNLYHAIQSSDDIDINEKVMKRVVDRYYDVRLFVTAEEKKRTTKLQIIFKACLVLIVYHRKSSDPLKWTSIDQLLSNYPTFARLDKTELRLLLNYRNMVKIALSLMPAERNKKTIMSIGAALEEFDFEKTNGNAYVTGGGQKPAVSRRVQIYEHESGIRLRGRRRDTTSCASYNHKNSTQLTAAVAHNANSDEASVAASTISEATYFCDKLKLLNKRKNISPPVSPREQRKAKVFCQPTCNKPRTVNGLICGSTHTRPYRPLPLSSSYTLSRESTSNNISIGQAIDGGTMVFPQNNKHMANFNPSIQTAVAVCSTGPEIPMVHPTLVLPNDASSVSCTPLGYEAIGLPVSAQQHISPTAIAEEADGIDQCDEIFSSTTATVCVGAIDKTWILDEERYWEPGSPSEESAFQNLLYDLAYFGADEISHL